MSFSSLTTCTIDHDMLYIHIERKSYIIWKYMHAYTFTNRHILSEHYLPAWFQPCTSGKRLNWGPDWECTKVSRNIESKGAHETRHKQDKELDAAIYSNIVQLYLIWYAAQTGKYLYNFRLPHNWVYKYDWFSMMQTYLTVMASQFCTDPDLLFPSQAIRPERNWIWIWFHAQPDCGSSN